MSASRLQLVLLGPVLVRRNGEPVPLPRSRKVRALLAYLALGSAPASRSRLCDLFWDVASDPRGELRWCLSKLRGVLDEDDRARVLTGANATLALDLSDCFVDALELERTFAAGIEQASEERLLALDALFAGEFLEGIDLDGSAELIGWIAAQRHRFRKLHAALRKELAGRAPLGAEERLRRLDAWLTVAPFDQHAHEAMLEALVASGRVRDAEAHAAAAVRSFEQEGLDWAPLRAAWHVSRAAAAASAPASRVAAIVPAESGPPPPAAPAARVGERARQRASVAVMPFVDKATGDAGRGRVSDGMTDDIITRLAKLRVLFVIARGTTYALGESGVGAQEAGRILNVDYVVTGSVRREASRVTVDVELAETENARIVWTDRLEAFAEDTFDVLDAIVDRVVAAIAEEIETEECKRALLAPPSSLDAWEAYHRGLWHMYKFNAPGNLQAEQLFRTAIALDPTFSRAYAGLSFTHFQNAFLELTPDHQRQIELAFESAALSVDADDRDPAAHWALGRALWLRGVEGESFTELERSIELSPNFALGHYTLGFVRSQIGDPRAAIESANYARQLSPFDPLQFGMLGSRALAHVRLGELDEAAEWAVRAAGRPNAHTHILAIAAECLALANRRDEARETVAQIRKRVPAYDAEDFLRAFRFDRDTQELFRNAARKIGFDASPAKKR